MPDQSVQLQDGTQLDPKILKVMKAIRTVESGGKYDAKGDYQGGTATSTGAYQWHGDNWKTAAKTVLGNENAEMTPANQNKVAYHQIKAYKDQGLQPEEIAARWNGAKIDPISGRYTYINPEYGKKFRIALGQPEPQVQTQPQGPLAPEVPKKKGGLMEGAKAVGDFLFPIVGDVYHDIKGDSQKGLLQQGADLGLSALPFVPGLGWGGEAARGAGLAAKLGRGALTGAGIGGLAGGLQATSQGGNIGDVAKGATSGVITGGLLGAGGGLLSKAAASLPQRFVMKYIPKLNSDTAEWTAKTKNLGSPVKMLAESDASLGTLGAKLGSVLEKPQFGDVQADGPEILQRAAASFKNAGYSAQKIVKNLKTVVKHNDALIDKMASGQPMTLKELNILKTAIGDSVYKTVFDEPTIKAGKEIGNSVYQEIKRTINEATSGETTPIFDELAKEYSLNRGLQSATKSVEKGKAIGLSELLSLATAFSGGPLAGAGFYATQKALSSPTVNMKAAGLIRSLGSKTAGKIGSQVLPQVARTAGMIQR